MPVLYPDSGSPFEDASILRNAVYFSTAQRSYSAQVILQEPLAVNRRVLAFLVMRAFQEFMTSTEDLVGWMFVLEQWRPGEAEFSLLLLLDRIQVGKKGKEGDYTEERAAALLAGLDEEGFRRLIHIPNDDELLASGMPHEEVEVINRSLLPKLEGWRRIVNSRVEQDRGWVRAFNKLKHHMLAFPTPEREKEEVWLPTRIRFDKTRNRVDLGRAWLGC